MKKRYMVPAATTFMLQTSGMLALSKHGTTTVNSGNADYFEVLTNKKNCPWGEEQKTGPWDQ